MMRRRFFTLSVVFIFGCLTGLLLTGHLGWHGGSSPAAAYAGPSSSGATTELETLRADVERLKQVVPDQAHAMHDVDYHFTNLWFAGQQQNWPLAEFYWKESLSHIKWAIRIIPVRKDNAGREIKLEEILQAIEMTPTMNMGDVIQKQNATAFEPTYRALLEGCYLCHKAADKPYLRPQVPTQPATRIVNFDPQATWPK